MEECCISADSPIAMVLYLYFLCKKSACLWKCKWMWWLFYLSTKPSVMIMLIITHQLIQWIVPILCVGGWCHAAVCLSKIDPIQSTHELFAVWAGIQLNKNNGLYPPGSFYQYDKEMSVGENNMFMKKEAETRGDLVSIKELAHKCWIGWHFATKGNWQYWQSASSIRD